MRTFQLSKQVYIKSGFTIVGPKEGDGNFADKFDIVLKNDIWCEKSFEKCESKMHRDAVSGAIKKAGLKREDIDIMLGGDLLNELAATSLAARNFPCAFLGALQCLLHVQRKHNRWRNAYRGRICKQRHVFDIESLCVG